MTIPNSFAFMWAASFAFIFFSFSDGDGLLPVDYVYVMFLVAAAFCAPYFLRQNVDRRLLIVALSLFAVGAVSSYGSGVPSAFLYSIGPIMLLLSQTGESICKTPRQRRSFAIWISFVLLACGVLGFPFLVPNYHGRLYLPHVGNPNYTAMLYLGMFVSVQIMLPNLRKTERLFLSISSYAVFGLILFATGTRSAVLSLIIFWVFRYALPLFKPSWTRNSATLLVVFTAIGQLLGYYAFIAVGVDADQRSSTSLLDASNLIRVTAFHTALMIVVNDVSFIWHGVGNVEGIWEILAASGDVEHVPHNWFMMMWLSNGAFFTFLTFGILIGSTRKIPLYYMPGFAALLVFALIVGRAVLFAPLCLFLISGQIRANDRA